MELSTALEPLQIELLEDYVGMGVNDLKCYPGECIHDRFKGQFFWVNHDVIVFRGSRGFARNFLFCMAGENLLPELKVGNLWVFIDEGRIEVIDRLIRQWEQKTGGVDEN